MPALAVLLYILSIMDPLSGFHASHYPLRDESPIIREGRQYAGWGNWAPDYMSLDRPYIWRQPWSENDRIVYAACMLSHEAQHVRLRTASEEVPLLYQYVCLERLGASQGLKDDVYRQLLDLNRVQEGTAE